jgi:Tfp pilus assembly protein PilX
MKQTGAILIQTLVFVLIIAISSITMVELTKSELQSTRAYIDQDIIFDKTQEALQVGEKWIATFTKIPASQTQCVQIPCVYTLSSTRNFHDKNQWQRLAKNLGDMEQPSYFIVELLEQDINQAKKITTEYYQITAISWSEQNHSRRIMQSVVSKKYGENDNALSNSVEKHSWRLVR